MSEESFENLLDFFKKMPSNVSIQQEKIDIEIQMEYFDAVKTLKTIDRESVLLQKDSIFDANLSVQEKKTLLVQLASIDNVEVYRLLEKYSTQPDPELKEWSILALQENRMLLESSLLGQNQVFISTGLGAKGNLLRYFVVFLSRTGKTLTEFQFRVTQKEVLFHFEKYNCEIEEIFHQDELITIICLMPMSLSMREMFQKIIHECNEMGNFLSQSFIITNVKILSADEIRNFLQQEKK